MPPANQQGHSPDADQDENAPRFLVDEAQGKPAQSWNSSESDADGLSPGIGHRRAHGLLGDVILEF